MPRNAAFRYLIGRTPHEAGFTTGLATWLPFGFTLDLSGAMGWYALICIVLLCVGFTEIYKERAAPPPRSRR